MLLDDGPELVEFPAVERPVVLGLEEPGDHADRGGHDEHDPCPAANDRGHGGEDEP